VPALDQRKRQTFRFKQFRFKQFRFKQL